MHALDQLLTPRLRLCRMHMEDLEDLTRLHLDPRVMATMAGVRSPEVTAEWLTRQVTHWERHGFGLWMARDRTSGAFLGRGGLHHVEIAGRDEVEVGYCFRAESWGRGLATELAQASVQAAFTMLHLSELVCFTQPTNLASQRVMQKAGFHYEYTGIHANLPHVFYRLTQSRWRTSNSSSCVGLSEPRP